MADESTCTTLAEPIANIHLYFTCGARALARHKWRTIQDYYGLSKETIDDFKALADYEGAPVTGNIHDCSLSGTLGKILSIILS